MKNIKIQLGFLLVMLVSLCSCEPRIEMDMGQWGDNSDITNVQIMKLETQDGVKLEEYYVDETTLTGTRRVVVSSGAAAVDEVAHTVTVNLKAGETITGLAFLIYHYGTRVEPLNGAPTAGIIGDLSTGPYTYRVHSADGSHTDWTIAVNQL